jgi:hypothetical protein
MQQILPLIIPLVVVAIILRRSMGTRKVRFRAMWIRPAVLLILAGVTLAEAPMPGPIALAAFLAAALVGGGVGYLRARHLELSVDPETGTVSSKSTPIGTILIVGLVGLRIGLRYMFPEMGGGQAGGHLEKDAVLWTDGALIFSAAMLVTQAIVIWQRTRPLLAEHAARSLPPAAPQ